MSIKPQALAQFLIVALTVMLTVAGCGSPQDSASEYLRQAERYFESGDLITAKIEVRNTLQIEPKNAKARFLLALINEREGEIKALLGNLQIAIDSDPSFVDARVKLGNYFVVGRQLEQAQEQADAAMAIAPDNDSVRLLDARVALLAGDTTKALDQGLTAISLAPERADAVSFVALLYARSGDLARALETIDAGISATDEKGVEALRGARISLLAEAGERERGEAELESMVRDYPDSRVYPMALAELYFANGRAVDAENVIRELVARDPDNTDWRLQLAALLARGGKPEAAEADLKQAIADSPDSVELKFAMAGFWESQGRIDDAISVYQDIADAAASSSGGIAARNRIAALNIGRNDELAQKLIGEVLADAPDNAEALTYRAAYRFSEQEFADAVADLRLALGKQPNSERALLLLARAYLLNSDRGLSEDTYRKLLVVNPANSAALRELAGIVGNRGNPEEAEALLRASLEVSPDSQEASRNLVKALIQQQDFDSAETEARRMLGEGDSTGVSDYQLGLILEQKKQYDQAIAAYRTALEKAPEADAPLRQLIQLLGSTGKRDEAQAYLVAHTQSHPGHEYGQLLLGEVYASNGDLAAAKESFQSVLSARPDSAGARMGLVSLHPRDSDEWFTALQDAHQSLPADPQIGLALGSAWSRKGDYEQSIAVYESVLAAGSDDDLVASNLAALLLDVRSDTASFARALELASRFERQESHPYTQAVLGWAYYRTADYARAVNVLEPAVARTGENPQIRYYLGMAYLRNGNPVSAEQQLRAAIQAADARQMTFTGLDEAKAELAKLAAGQT